MNKHFTTTLAALALLASPALAADKTEVVCQTLQFGSNQYTESQTFETVFSELSDKISLKTQETPGALFIVRTMFESQDAFKSGKEMPAFSPGSTQLLPIVMNGLPPFEKFPVPTSRILFGTGYSVFVFVSFDPAIKTPYDLTGKKVGFAEKSRPFVSSQPNEWLFSRGYKNWDKVDWQYLGTGNSKDALLNNRLDAHWTQFKVMVEMDENGKPYVTQFALSPDMLEIANSGRKLYYVTEDPAVWEATSKEPKDLLYAPIRVPAGTFPGQEEEIWARFGSSVYSTDAAMPDEIAAELVRLRVEALPKLQTYHDMFKLYPQNPYPIDAPLNLMHPGAVEQMRKMGFAIPQN